MNLTIQEVPIEPRDKRELTKDHNDWEDAHPAELFCQQIHSETNFQKLRPEVMKQIPTACRAFRIIAHECHGGGFIKDAILYCQAIFVNDSDKRHALHEVDPGKRTHVCAIAHLNEKLES
ncbi:hypothetical protein G3M48_007028 [Beauveria asiatica]|uniref:Uncharacterized protein n=1 Tax=Beauveria asiatica TaxID=1069075 RepID=A0AAW0S4S0_9HYPO